jgi:hypothetical protein
MTSATRVIAKQQALHRNTDPRSRRFDFFGREKFMSNSNIAHQQNWLARDAEGKQGVTLAGRSGWEDFFS